MNKTLLSPIFRLLFLICLSSTAQAQLSEHILGVSTAVSDNALAYPKIMMDGASLNELSTAKYGVHYTYQKNKNLGLQTGLEFLNMNYSISPMFIGMVQSPSLHEIQLLSLSLKLKYTFFNFLYLNGGLIVDSELKNTGGVNNQSGIGLGAGLGAQYFFKNKIGLFVNPQLAKHSMIDFSDASSTRKLYEASISLGVNYKL